MPAPRTTSLVLAVAAAGSLAAGGAVASGPPAAAFAPVRLLPLPARVATQCRLASRLRLCPQRLPRATLSLRPGAAPPPLFAVRAGPLRDGDAEMIGISFAYGAPWEPGSGSGWRRHLWRNGPCCFLHFELWRAIRGTPPFPATARPAVVGGRRGELAPATALGMACGPGDAGVFFCNHLRFRWRERGSWYVATLHHFGRIGETRALLARILRQLRPIAVLNGSIDTQSGTQR